MVNHYVWLIVNLSASRQTLPNAIDCYIANKIPSNEDQSF
jgi:hypothetical protein